ncbi:MAG: sigma-70 family RNA polymerase sigma factor [Candidatus Aminicenantes bacterium]|nr:sigma-70 family RNA polymerase sigma factor [Candidatus Aminicenantes bacterium]
MKKTENSYDLKKITSKYRPIVTYKVKKSIGSHTPEWEDIVNEIMLNTIEKVKSGEFKGQSSIGTFIYTITRRRIIDHIRRKKKKIKKHIPESDPFPDPYVQIENKERAEMLAKKLEELKPKYKKVLYLYYYKGLARKEVAQKLGISPRRVSERVHYAQKLLRKIINK